MGCKPEIDKDDSPDDYECEHFGTAGWSINPFNEELPFEYCKECLRQKECKLKDLISQEESYYERMAEKGDF